MQFRYSKTRILLFSIVIICALAVSAKAEDTFPIHLGGKVIDLGLGKDRATLTRQIAQALPGEEPSVMTAERVQYDYAATNDAGPLTVALDFDTSGLFIGVIIGSYTNEENPCVQELLTWLQANAGKGEPTVTGMIWEYIGMTFEFTEILHAGEDSIYQIDAIKTGYAAP